MNKSEILKSIKIALLSIVLLVGVGTVFADDWTAPTGSAPEENTPTPINIDSNTQTKEGDLTFDWIYADKLHSLSSATFFDEVRIGKEGEMGNPSLTVLGDITFNNLSSNNLDNEGETYPRDICVKSDGTLELCDTGPLVEPEEPFTFNEQFIVRRVIGSDSATASCGEERPFAVGGGGLCSDFDVGGIFDNSKIRKSIPVKSGAYYDGWYIECVTEDSSAYAYVYCSD